MVHLRSRQHFQNLILNLLELLLVFSTLQDELVLLLLQLRPLLGHHNAQQLVLEPQWGDHEIEQGDLGRGSGEGWGGVGSVWWERNIKVASSTASVPTDVHERRLRHPKKYLHY